MEDIPKKSKSPPKEENKLYTGKKVDKFGNIYEGFLLNGKAEGHGIKYYKDGRKFEGEFKNDLRHGYGVLNRPDGTIFKGIYDKDYQEGEGININKEGKILKGYFKAGKAINGACIMYYGEGNNDYLNFDEECVYEGFYRNGKRDGYGKFTMVNGDMYEGEFRNDCYNGKGVYKWQNGVEYIGKFKDNKKEGFGILKNTQLGNLIGLWVNDAPVQIRVENNLNV